MPVSLTFATAPRSALALPLGGGFRIRPAAGWAGPALAYINTPSGTQGFGSAGPSRRHRFGDRRNYFRDRGPGSHFPRDADMGRLAWANMVANAAFRATDRESHSLSQMA